MKKKKPHPNLIGGLCLLKLLLNRAEYHMRKGDIPATAPHSSDFKGKHISAVATPSLHFSP